MSLQNETSNKKIWAWAFYDWANSSFATTVMAGFFPLFFKTYWSVDSAQQSTFLLGAANSTASIVLVLTAPFLGALADFSFKRKQFLLFFAVLGACATSSLYLLDQNQQFIALALYAIGSLGFLCGNIFYDSLLTAVAPVNHYNRVSGFGYALGYLGGALLFSAQVFVFLNPDLFGLSSPAEAVKVAFFSVGVWWLVFTIPLALTSFDRQNRTDKFPILKATAQHVVQTLKHIYNTQSLFYFLLAYLFYYDGVNTVIKMAVDYGMALGFESKDLITALLITNFVGFPAAIFYGYWGEKIGALKGIRIAIFAYIAVAIWGSFINSPIEFYVLAGVIGLFQGGIQALSRSYFASKVPSDKASEYFGFFNLLGKFSAVFGPILMGFVALASGSHRLSLLVVVLFFSLGLWLLNKHAKRA